MSKEKECIYCPNHQPSTHFICDFCGVGMCDDCYDSMTEHDSHYNEICDGADEEYYDAYVKEVGYEPAYLCEKCVTAICKKYKLK